MGSSKKHKDKEKERDRDRKRDKDRRHRKRSRSRDRDDKDHERRREHRDSDGDRKKTRGGDDDDLFEYALQEIQNDQSGGPVQSHNEGSSGGGGSGDSLSIEETNKLRAKLGLKPLQVGDDKDKPEEKKTALLDDVHVPAKNMAEKTMEENMRRKLEEIREKRKIHQKLLKVKTLGDEDSDDDSAASWVKKSRKKEKEREMAEKRAKMLEEMDAEFGVGDLIKEEFGAIKQKSYTSRDLRGLTVQHDQTTFKDGMTTVLTLKDQGILDDDGDTLVNVNIEDFEKANKNQELKKKKPTYQAYDDVDENDMFKVKGVLDKYDEEIDGEKKKTFALGAGGQFDASQEDDLQKIKERLRNEMVSLEMAKPKIASEYYTEEEMLKFKKPKKKRKIRKREPLKADDLETIAGSSAMTSDHGSRSNKSRVQAPQQTNYGEEAMEIAPLEHEEQGNHFHPVPQENDNFVLEDDQAQLELEVALQRSRLAKKKKDKVGAEKVIQDLAAVTKQEQSTDKEGASIVIDSTSEFCRALGEIPTYGTSGNREEEEDDDDDDEWRMDIDHQSKETQGGWELVETQDEKKKIDVQKLEEESRVLDEEPIVGSGMAAALLLASKKGLLNAASKKKQEDKFVAELPSVGIIDEEKMSGEGKDRGRRERDYDRDKDRYRVEKEGYVPKVKIDYVDEHGRQMTPKEAFRYLSHRFHGKMPAKLKTEKRNKKVMEDMAMQKMSSVDTPLNTAALLKDKQKESQSPYLILSGGGNTLSVGTTISKKK